MGQALQTNDNSAIAERVMITGDLSQLSPAERVQYYGEVCRSLGLNPLTKPFEYITLNGKLTLYAKKDCTDQLRASRGVSIGKPDIQFQDNLIIVAVEAHDATGRTDSDVGVLDKASMKGDVSNAIMKAVTKAKRRVTLSICGLGWADETEVETIPDAKPVIVAETGEIITQGSKPIVKAEPVKAPDAKPTGKLERTPEQFHIVVSSDEANTYTLKQWQRMNEVGVELAEKAGRKDLVSAHAVPGDITDKVEVAAHTIAIAEELVTVAQPA